MFFIRWASSHITTSHSFGPGAGRPPGGTSASPLLSQAWHSSTAPRLPTSRLFFVGLPVVDLWPTATSKSSSEVLSI